jgi:hypothetical protein
LLALLSSLLVGCFEVREEITLNRNRSGTYRLVVDISGMSGMMDQLGETLGGEDATEEGGGPAGGAMEPDMAEQADLLNQVEGISNVSAVADGGGIGLSFDFKNLTALNDALDVLAAQDDSGASSPLEFTRCSLARGAGIGLGFDGEQEEDGMDMLAMMEPTYTLVFTAPRKIRSVSNEAGATLSVDGKTLTITASLAEVASGALDLTNVIKYR